jgi:hypothetical protein
MKDLTILIQGPYFEYNQYNSNENIKILKKSFPDAEILISTWKNENKFKLDANDKIIYNDDPGTIIDNCLGSITNGSNILRQITSVKNGLNQINTKYTLKIRSDTYFKSNKIIKLDLNKFIFNERYKIFEERIVISTIGSLNQKNTKILYNFSDWFNFGLTSDLKKIWNYAKVENEDINYFTKFKNKKKNIYGKNWDLKFTAEQFIFFKSISQFIEDKIEHAQDYSKKKLLSAEKYLINNLYLVDPDKVDFVFPKYDSRINKFLNKSNTNLRNNELIFLSYSENDWLNIYNKKCNNYKFSFNFKKSYFLLKFKIKNFIYKFLNSKLF